MYHTVKVYAYCTKSDYSKLVEKKWSYVDIVHMDDYSRGPDSIQMNDDRRVYVSIGGNKETYTWLVSQSDEERLRWIHHDALDTVSEESVYECMLSATEPVFSTEDVRDTDNEVPENPLVTVYTSAYNSLDKILKPFKSLVKQTYKNWEWVIVDDSTRADTWNNYLSVLQEKLPSRIRVYDSEGTPMTDYVKNGKTYNAMHCGIIGKMKGLAVSKGNGHILLEMDHDDELVPGALQRIVDAFMRNRTAGFVYSSCCELHDKTLEGHNYGLDFAYGFGTFWHQWDSDLQTVVYPMVNARLNAISINHLIGLPNHPRAWSRSAYEKAGGYRSSLLVSDDYDLLIRTFLTNRFAEIPDMLYRQYRYTESKNTLVNVTMSRNEQIQILVDHIRNHYFDRIMKRLSDLGMPLQIRHSRYVNILDMSPEDHKDKHCTIIDHDKGISTRVIFYHISLNAKSDIQIARHHVNDPHTVVCMFIEELPGDTSREQMLIELAKKLPDGKIKWRIVHPSISLDAEKKWSTYIHGVDTIVSDIVM